MRNRPLVAEWMKPFSLVLLALALVGGGYLYQVNQDGRGSEESLANNIKMCSRGIKAIYGRHNRCYDKFSRRQAEYERKDIIRVRVINGEFKRSYDQYMGVLQNSRKEFDGLRSPVLRKKLLMATSEKSNTTHEHFKELISEEEDIVS